MNLASLQAALGCDAEQPEYAETDLQSDEVERDEGQRIGIERGEHGNGQVDARENGDQGRADRLKGRRQQAAEHACGDPARHGATGEPPDTRFYEGWAEHAQESIGLELVRAGQVLLEVVFHHCRKCRVSACS